jgi:hypothetical protein
MHAHHIPMNTSERLSRFDFEIYKSIIKSVSLSMKTSPLTKKIISHKYNIYTKFKSK